MSPHFPDYPHFLDTTYDPAMIVCAFRNYIGASDPRLVSEPLWTRAELFAEAELWFQQNSFSKSAESYDPTAIIMNAEFLQHLGLSIRLQPNMGRMLILVNEFNAHYGPGTAEDVMSCLVNNKSVDTRELRKLHVAEDLRSAVTVVRAASRTAIPFLALGALLAPIVEAEVALFICFAGTLAGAVSAVKARWWNSSHCTCGE